MLKLSPKELLLGLIVNTKPTPLEESSSVLRPTDTLTQIAYVEQQCLDCYEETVRLAIKCKTAFDKKILQCAPGEVIFKPGQLVQVYRNDLDYTFKVDWKLLPKWSVPRRVKYRLRNLYKLETLEGILLQGEYSARRLRAFIPRTGTKLAKKQEEHEKKIEEKRLENTQGRLEDKDNIEQAESETAQKDKEADKEADKEDDKEDDNEEE